MKIQVEVSGSQRESPNLDILKTLRIILQSELETEGDVLLDRKRESISFHSFSLEKSWEFSRTAQQLDMSCDSCVVWQLEDT